MDFVKYAVNSRTNGVAGSGFRSTDGRFLNNVHDPRRRDQDVSMIVFKRRYLRIRHGLLALAALQQRFHLKKRV